MPRGVYLGFTPVTTPGSDVLALEVDADHGFSLLKVGSQSRPVQIDIYTNSNVQLDFTGHLQFPVYVIATADYKSKTPTQAKIFTRMTTASGSQEVLLCQVDKPGVDLVASAIDPDTKQSPVAFQGQPYGFMLDGAIDDLSAGTSTRAEVIAARISPYTAPTGGTPGVDPHPDLRTRIDTDLSGFEMANRLALRPTNVISNVHPVPGGATLVNVSGSFTETQRGFGPTLTIEPSGSETVEGAITTSPRNICFIVDGATGQRIIDETTREPVYGELSFTSGTAGVGKEIQFTTALTSVSGNGTNPFQTPLAEGDIVLGPDGLYYELASFVDPDNAELGAAFAGTSGSVFDTGFRRFLVSFFTVAGGAFVLPATPARTVQALFPCFFRTDRAIFDGLLLIKREGERPQLPAATSSTPGKALLAATGGLVGSVRTIKDGGSAIGTDIHTLNFVNGGASDAGGGVANISVQGATGAPGPSSDVGPTGPSGGAGPGYAVNNAFEGSGPSTVTGGTPSSISFTFDFSSTAPIITNVEYLYGGFAGFDAPQVQRTYEITNIQIIPPSSGRIDGQVSNGSGTTFELFLGASQ